MSLSYVLKSNFTSGCSPLLKSWTCHKYSDNASFETSAMHCRCCGVVFATKNVGSSRPLALFVLARLGVRPKSRPKGRSCYHTNDPIRAYMVPHTHRSQESQVPLVASISAASIHFPSTAFFHTRIVPSSPLEMSKSPIADHLTRHGAPPCVSNSATSLASCLTAPGTPALSSRLPLVPPASPAPIPDLGGRSARVRTGTPLGSAAIASLEADKDAAPGVCTS